MNTVDSSDSPTEWSLGPVFPWAGAYVLYYRVEDGSRQSALSKGREESASREGLDREGAYGCQGSPDQEEPNQYINTLRSRRVTSQKGYTEAFKAIACTSLPRNTNSNSEVRKAGLLLAVISFVTRMVSPQRPTTWVNRTNQSSIIE